MNKETLKAKITNFILNQNDIVFFVFFGSFVKSEHSPFRDIDIALYMTESPDLKRLGFLISELEYITQCKIDVVVLNKLYDVDPLFSQEIVSCNEMIPNTNVLELDAIRERYATYCLRSLNMYEDTKDMRRKMGDAFKKRLEHGEFAG